MCAGLVLNIRNHEGLGVGVLKLGSLIIGILSPHSKKVLGSNPIWTRALGSPLLPRLPPTDLHLWLFVFDSSGEAGSRGMKKTSEKETAALNMQRRKLFTSL